jgi:pimeloyl-[acyl-carrier protein] synthase
MEEDNQTLDDYTLFCRGRLANPYPLYQRLRSEDPVHWSDLANSWILTRYDDVRFALQYDPRLTAERLSPLLKQLPATVQSEVEPLRQLLSTWMQYYDPPDHTRLRKLVNKTFTPRILEHLRPRIQAIVDELIDTVYDSGQIEVIREFAYPLPAIVVAELLGVPAEDRDAFKQWSDDIAEFLEGVAQDYAAVARHTNQSVLELTDYLGRLFDERRRHPRADLISALVAVEEEGDKLSEAELFGMCSFILEAGHETTTGLIGNGLLAFLRHPDQMQKLKNDPSLINTAVEECLRYDSSIQRISRVAVQEFELRDKRIKPGERIWAMQGAANRDPAQFPDPDRFDISRQKNRHVAFGYGVHHCLGASLARLEGQIAFNTLLRRMPELQLATETLAWQPGVSLRILKSLPVTF